MARTITIDASGRLVIPKEIRERHHLHSGARLELAEEDDRLVLVPVASQTPTREEAGLLVFTGTLVGRIPDHRELREVRLAGLTES